MDLQAIGFALAAGLVAALNPCGFAMLPGYLALVVTGESGAPAGRITAVGRALTATAMMAAGFLVVFGSFALILAPLAASVQHYLPVLTVIIGVGLLLLGGWMLSGREVTLLLPKSGRGAPTARLRSMFGYGVAYAVASLSCTIGPFLAVTGTTFRTGSILNGIAAYLAYALGMALLVGLLATAIALAAAPVTAWLRGATQYLTRVGGALLLATSAYVIYYGIYELRLSRGGGTEDPIIGAAGRIQRAISAWVGSVGVLPIALGFLAVVALAVVTRWRRGRRRTPAMTDHTAPSGGLDSGADPASAPNGVTVTNTGA